MAINVFTASGNIGKDCEVRVTPNGKSVATFSLPVKQGYGDYEKVSWVTCKILGGLAESTVPGYLVKGKKVTVSGEFVLEEWQGQNGEQNKMPVIIVRDIDLGGKSDGNNQQNMADNGASGSQNANKPPQFQKPQVDDDDFGDSIPF